MCYAVSVGDYTTNKYCNAKSGEEHHASVLNRGVSCLPNGTGYSYRPVSAQLFECWVNLRLDMSPDSTYSS
jgi:hypothetical protein